MRDKIASPDELQAELRKLLAYAESNNPSRVKLAAGMKTLASRVAGGNVTEVWLNVGPHSVVVAVVGLDDRIIASVQGELLNEAEMSGAAIEDDNPHGLRTPPDMGYMGFTAEDEPRDLRDLVRHLKKEAEHHSWVDEVRVQRGWPRI